MFNFYLFFLALPSKSDYPKFLLSIHSSKILAAEFLSPPSFILADVMINLTITKGQRHEVCCLLN